MDNLENVKKDKGNRLRNTLIIIFIIIPIFALSLTYYVNKTFKTKIDKLMGKLPGTVGEYFRTSPTEAERKDMQLFLANHYLTLEPETAADKLYIIKREDEKLYSGIIRLMNSNSSSKTEDIIKLVRSMELRKDLLFSIHEEIQNERDSILMDEKSRMENQDLLVTINEIERRIESDRTFKESLPEIITNMRQDKVVDILYYINEDMKDQILISLNNNIRTKIEGKLLAKMTEQNKLTDLASLYEEKSIEIALNEIGNTENYSIEELGIIYKSLSPLKAAEILSKINNEDFIEELFTAVRKEEDLSKEETITTDISKSIQFITEYNKKLEDLVIVYEKMSPDKVAKIVEKMMNNNNTITILEINSEPVYEITDSSIIIDVLSRMRNKTVSNIMNYMSDDKASTLTQMLVRP